MNASKSSPTDATSANASALTGASADSISRPRTTASSSATSNEPTNTANIATNVARNDTLDSFTPLLTSTDWNEEWMTIQARQNKTDDARQWDSRAIDFATKHGPHGPYAERFIALAELRPGEVVLDMGCGSGTLALPLAARGHKVIACDFSGGMLEQLRAGAAAQGLSNIHEIQMSWEDDWPTCGVAKRSVDVAIASRSIATANLKYSLEKLTAAARRRACITLPCGPTPKVNMRLIQAAGLTYSVGRAFLYAFNILCQLGYYPTVDYIESTRIETFASREEALEHYTRLVQRAAHNLATPDELAQVPGHLKTWLKDELVENEGTVQLRKPITVVWAFLSWDVNRGSY